MTHEKKSDEHFTATEVGTLVESFRNDIAVIPEDLTSVKTDVGILKTDVHELKTDMKIVRDVIRVAVPSHSNRISALEAKTGL